MTGFPVLTDDTAAGFGVLEYSYRHAGTGGILRIIEHAAIWSLVRRVIDRLPLGLVVVAVIALVMVGFAGSLRRRRRVAR